MHVRTHLPPVGSWIQFTIGSDGTNRGATCYGKVARHEHSGSFQNAVAVLENGAEFRFARGDRCTFVSDEPAGAIELRRAYETYEEQMKAAADAHGKTLCEVAERHAHERHAVDQLHQDDLEKARIAHAEDLKKFGAQERAERVRLTKHLLGTRLCLAASLAALLVVAYVYTPLPERLAEIGASVTTLVR